MLNADYLLLLSFFQSNIGFNFILMIIYVISFFSFSLSLAQFSHSTFRKTSTKLNNFFFNYPSVPFITTLEDPFAFFGDNSFPFFLLHFLKCPHTFFFRNKCPHTSLPLNIYIFLNSFSPSLNEWGKLQ